MPVRDPSDKKSYRFFGETEELPPAPGPIPVGDQTVWHQKGTKPSKLVKQSAKQAGIMLIHGAFGEEKNLNNIVTHENP